jgi:hypothetical protein
MEEHSQSQVGRNKNTTNYVQSETREERGGERTRERESKKLKKIIRLRKS